MSRSDSNKMTPFDKLISSRELQMLKLFLPYTPATNQKMLAICIKFMELKHTIQFFQHVQKDIHAQAFEKPVSTPFDMLEELRPYLSDEEQAKMDSFLSIMNLMEMMAEMQKMSGDIQGFSNTGDFNSFDFMKGMLNPEQQEMFEMYQDMFQDKEEKQNYDTESHDSETKGGFE